MAEPTRHEQDEPAERHKMKARFFAGIRRNWEYALQARSSESIRHLANIGALSPLPHGMAFAVGHDCELLFPGRPSVEEISDVGEGELEMMRRQVRMGQPLSGLTQGIVLTFEQVDKIVKSLASRPGLSHVDFATAESEIDNMVARGASESHTSTFFAFIIDKARRGFQADMGLLRAWLADLDLGHISKHEPIAYWMPQCMCRLSGFDTSSWSAHDAWESGLRHEANRYSGSLAETIDNAIWLFAEANKREDKGRSARCLYIMVESFICRIDMSVPHVVRDFNSFIPTIVTER
ncbi:hypothetical protein HIM_03717 [Hirsutella minnesotensis 3608]|uniref:Uncharacterized protein n=1 Tax=Hirsutella minnesotensis 3608 TaxID=1043627 RepID=A0A0F7ZQ91_9HYPO|nr:hypothetical protein HIM_03717 [Hirsutella minnesotensis 3608]